MATYAFSDLHGQYDLWRQIKEFCKPDDKLYFLGDAADRGEQGVRIIQELIADPRVTYLKGNHEYFIEQFFNDANIDTLKLWSRNGGDPTQRDLMALPEEELSTLLDKITNLPYSATYINTQDEKIFMSHSGYYDYLESDSPLDKKWNKILLLQDREHIGKTPVDTKKIDYIVHGHTPVHYIWVMLNLSGKAPLAPLGYDNGKIGIDLCSIATEAAALFNLDTFEYTLFTTKN